MIAFPSSTPSPPRPILRHRRTRSNLRSAPSAITPSLAVRVRLPRVFHCLLSETDGEETLSQGYVLSLLYPFPRFFCSTLYPSRRGRRHCYRHAPPPPPPRLFLLLLVLETSLTAFARRNDSTKRNRISTRIGASPSFPSPLSLFYLLSFSFLSSLFSVLFSFLSSFPPLLLFFFSSSAALCCSRCTSPSRYSTHHFCRQSQLPTCLRMLLEFIGRVARIFQFLLL